MKVTVERTPDSEAVLNVELDWSEIEKASDRAYPRLAQRYPIKGFRPGKVPRRMFEERFGREVVYQEGLEDLIESSYRDAIRENKLTPLGQPHLHAADLELGQPYTYTAHVPVLAPVELGDYKDLHLARPDTTVTDTDIDAVLENVRQDQATWEPVERPAEIGDRVTVDLTLTVGDRTVSDLHDNEFTLVEERVGIFAGMDQQIVGMTAGEAKDFTTTIPEDYANTELAGKEAQFHVEVKTIKAHQLPEIDDELAKSVGPYESLADLRQAVKAQLETQKENDARRKQRDDVVNTVAERSSVQIHPLLVQDEQDVMVNEFKRLLEQSRISFDQYLTMAQKTEEEYRADLEPEARERVKRDLTLDAIADAEGITVSDSEIQSFLDALASVGGQRLRLRDLSSGQRANVVARLRRDKVIALLVETAEANGPAEPQAETSAEQTAQTTQPEATTEGQAAGPRIRVVDGEDVEAGAQVAAIAGAQATEAGAPAATATTTTGAAATTTGESESAPTPAPRTTPEVAPASVSDVAPSATAVPASATPPTPSATATPTPSAAPASPVTAEASAGADSDAQAGAGPATGAGSTPAESDV